MRLMVLVVFLIASWSTSAQSVYKCVGKGGATSFQSDPCEGNSRVSKVWDASPENPSNAEQWRRYNARQKSLRDAAYLRSLAHGVPSSGSASAVGIPTHSNGCSNARRSRDVYYANHPKRKSKDMERWNKHVYDACK